VSRDWWSYLLFINNLYPPGSDGLYWLYFTANELQFYIFVMAPSLYLYQRRYRRRLVLMYLAFLIAASMIYLFLMTIVNDYSVLLTVSVQSMFDKIYRYPIGPVGYYALGIMLAIFLFEYQQSISNRELKERKAYKVIRYITGGKRRQLRFQIVGFLLLTFLVFIRYLNFMGLSKDDLSSLSVTRGTWPSWLNALFNATAHYLFIASIVVIFIPIFAGKLSLIRDVYAAPFFRPFARTNFTLACFQGLYLQFIFFSQTQSIKFEHKNFMFLFCGILIIGYLLNFLGSMLLEWPFRTMTKLVFQAPRRRMLKLKDDLARELNTNDDFYEDEFETP
jgi:hypothetical protein